MADYDHICIYRQFFEEFAKMPEMEISRPMRVNPYDLSFDELVGEVMSSCVNYLVERKCPRSLVVPLTKIVVEEFINEAKKEPEEVNTPLNLNRKTHDKILEVCLRFTDNEKLSSLPDPVEEIYYSAHSTKHTRRRMEDRLIYLPRFHALYNIPSTSEAGYYGIFDGHNGVNAACYAVSHLHQFLAESEYYPDNPIQAFRQAFEKTESKYNSKDGNSGTTVLAILHQPVEKKLTVAWVGDSQAMLINEDSFFMLIDPHKPERADERRRIEALGGCIIRAQSVYRVNGGLAISRAIGDKKLKPYISAEPDIRVFNLTGSEHFIVMGCDGLWDVVEPQQVIDTVYFEVKKNQGQVDSIAKRLVDLAKENNSTDNISVIVIFLTDPADISNRSVDVTGHRPKILHQDGVIMEANFQTNDKSSLNDSDMNGIYGTNGNHFNDHLKNESDEDFGPETDVDAIDDALTSTKNLNPFAKDYRPKTTDENTDKLIELPICIESEITKFTEDSAETPEPSDLRQINNNEIQSDKFPIDNMSFFETAVTNNASESVNILHNFSEDNLKYIDEIHSRKEAENFMSPKILDQSFGLEINLEEKKNLLEIAEGDHFDFDGEDLASAKQTVSCTATENTNLLFNEERKPELKEDIETLPLVSETEKELMSESYRELEAKKIENNESQSNEKSMMLDEFRESNLKTTEEPVNIIEQMQNTPLNDSQNPSLLNSVIDTVKEEKISCDFCPGKNVATERRDESSSELFSSSALVLDGELKDETVAESGGEIEDSEDDEWNYIKVESGTHQGVPLNSKVGERNSPSNKLSESEKPTMNSPLNPEADEFIPVSAMSSNNEYNLNMTPKKAIPDDLTDIIASSPNWSNMNKVSLPEETAFLSEIKSRPSNIFENVDSPQLEEFGEKNNDPNSSLNFTFSGEIGKENELVTLTDKEPHGLDLASDMTSSFIDPSTLSSEVEKSEEKLDLMNSHVENFIIEKQEMFFNESAPEVQEQNNEEFSSKLSPVPVQEDVSPPTPSLEILDMSAMKTPIDGPESVSTEFSQLSVQGTDIEEREPSEMIQVTIPSKNAQGVAEIQILSETFSKSPDDDKSNEVKADAGNATTPVAEDAAAKKDVIKHISTAISATKLKTAPSPRVVLNESKTSTTAKKPTTVSQTAKLSLSGKTASVIPTTSAKTTASKTSAITKTQPKSTAPSPSTISRAPTRPRPLPAVSTAPRASHPSKAAVTSSPRKPSTTANTNNSTTTNTTTTTTLKSINKTTGSSCGSTTLKSRPKFPSATAEKATPAINGELKSRTKRTETAIKKSGGTTATTTTTRVFLSSRSVTAPAKPTTLKTTGATSRIVSAKPKTTLSPTATSTLLSPSSKMSLTNKKSTISADKQAKEVANRLTSKAALKRNSVAPKNPAPTVTKTGKSLTSTTTTSKSVKNHDKTENKAEKIIDEKLDIIQSENKTPLVDNDTDINKINSFASE